VEGSEKAKAETEHDFLNLPDYGKIEI